MAVRNDSKVSWSLESTHRTAGNGGKAIPVLRVYSKCFGLQHKSHKRPSMEMASLRLHCDMRGEFESNGSCKSATPKKNSNKSRQKHIR